MDFQEVLRFSLRSWMNRKICLCRWHKNNRWKNKNNEALRSQSLVVFCQKICYHETAAFGGGALCHKRRRLSPYRHLSAPGKAIFLDSRSPARSRAERGDAPWRLNRSYYCFHFSVEQFLWRFKSHGLFLTVMIKTRKNDRLTLYICAVIFSWSTKVRSKPFAGQRLSYL